MSVSAPCPTATPGSSDPPTSIVVVSILSVKPNTDLEGDDDYVPFYDNRADIYGKITIDGQEFDLPQIDENDFPHWNENGVFRKKVSTPQVAIRIDIWEADDGLTGDDDHVKICPSDGKAYLDLVFDLCSLQISGDITGSAGSVITVSGGNGDEDATIEFKVELDDGRPVSTDDLALVEIDLVQVRHHTRRLVAGKPTVVMARIANNFSIDVTTSLRVKIFPLIAAGGFPIDDTFPIEIKAGEVKKVYLYTDAPITFPPSDHPYPIAVGAFLDDPGSHTKQADCRNLNDTVVLPRTNWKVITTQPLSFLWMKVGTLLDIGNYTPDDQFTEIKELGHAYIKGVFPVVNPGADASPIPLSPPINDALDFMVSVLSSFGIPVDALEPFALVFELNSIAVLTGYNRLMGVLPSHDWFKRFSYWEKPIGLSLGEFAPLAVIFLPALKSDDGLQFGPAMTLPGHELGHTYGLSTDSSLKKSWVCSIDWPVVGSLPCGAKGGFDEYKNEDVNLQDGNPASGYWVPQGGEPAAISSFLNQEQCNSHCLMGTAVLNAHLNWMDNGRWIDSADYDQLLDKLSIVPDPEVIYVSGMIAWSDHMYLGPIYHLRQGTPDREDSFGLYAVRFQDHFGKTIREYGIPINWNIAEYDRAMPVLFFGLKLPYPEGTQRIVFLNRGTNKTLAVQEISAHAPVVWIHSPGPGRSVKIGSPLTVEWEAVDEDHDPLTFTVLIGPGRERWWPVVSKLSASRFTIDTAVLEPGDYHLKVLAHDGVHIGESQSLELRMIGP